MCVSTPAPDGSPASHQNMRGIVKTGFSIIMELTGECRSDSGVCLTVCVFVCAETHTTVNFVKFFLYD